MLIGFYCPNLTSEKRFIRCSIPCIMDLCTAPSSVFQQIRIRYENPKLPKSADEEMVRLGWLLVGKNMDELKRKNLPKNDPRTQICPLVGSCAFLAFHLLSLFFGRRAFMWGLCQISPNVNMNKTMKQRKTMWMASIASFYHLQIYPIGISSAVSSLGNNNLSRCSWFLETIWQLLPLSTTPAVHSSYSSRCRAMRDWHHLPQTTLVENLSKKHLAKCNNILVGGFNPFEKY